MTVKGFRAHKEQTSRATKQAVTAMAPGIEAALVNEQITRSRVEQLEALARRGLMGRLRWLVTGR